MARYKICHDMKNGLIHCNLRPSPSVPYRIQIGRFIRPTMDLTLFQLALPTIIIHASWIVSSLTSKLRIVCTTILEIHFFFSIHGREWYRISTRKGREEESVRKFSWRERSRSLFEEKKDSFFLILFSSSTMH